LLRAHKGFDGIVAIGGCDKNMPGCIMGLARLNRPSVFVYGGTIQPGKGHTRYFYLLRWRLVHWSLANSCPGLRLRMPSY
jgi:dihydroxyacid dehydratase/phosphogluconate dehydratase